MKRFLRAVLRLVPRGTVVRVFSGQLRGARWLMHSATHGCWLGTYERDSQAVFARLVSRGDVVLDIGANVGFFTILASRLVGREGTVCAFEPLPRNVELLKEHVRLNAASNVRVFAVAVASTIGRASFEVAGSPSMGRLAETGSIEVETASLDSFWRSGALSLPTFMKIDVEGAEYEVLTGARELLDAARPAILLAAHGYVQHDACVALLKDAGYDIQTIRDGTADGDYLLLARAQ
ncbi:MAG TPA: FkbM family methyltransferase [Thermoanaerobaculia bacterium]|nr:FkbM family methyltransferase [Thermoanaerobaculia bacterium]